MYAHEQIIVVNPGLRSERIVFTGDEEWFRTEDEAQKSVDRLNARHPGLDLGIFNPE